MGEFPNTCPSLEGRSDFPVSSTLFCNRGHVSPSPVLGDQTQVFQANIVSTIPTKTSCQLSFILKIILWNVDGGHTFNTWEGRRQNSVNSRPIWSMELVQGQSSLHKETLSQKTKMKQKDPIFLWLVKV